ncbi:gamma-glutamylcyclotransferase, partial [Persephonella sp.]
MKSLIFVYGTLRKGFGNHRLLENAEFLGIGRTKEKYK